MFICPSSLRADSGVIPPQASKLRAMRIAIDPEIGFWEEFISAIVLEPEGISAISVWPSLTNSLLLSSTPADSEKIKYR